MSNHHPPRPPARFFGLPEINKLKANLLGYFTALQRTYGDTVRLHIGPYDYYAF